MAKTAKHRAKEVALSMLGNVKARPWQIAHSMFVFDSATNQWVETNIIKNYRPETEYKATEKDGEKDFASKLAMGWSPAWPIDVCKCPPELGETILENRKAWLVANKMEVGTDAYRTFLRLWGDGNELKAPEYIGMSGFRRSRLISLVESLLRDKAWLSQEEHEGAPSWEEWDIYANVYPVTIRKDGEVGEVGRHGIISEEEYLRVLELQLLENGDQEGKRPVSEQGNLVPACLYFKQGRPLSYFSKVFGASKGHKLYMAAYYASLRPEDNLIERWQLNPAEKGYLKFSGFDNMAASKLKNGEIPSHLEGEIGPIPPSMQPETFIQTLSPEMLTKAIQRPGKDDENKPTPRKDKVQLLYKAEGIAPHWKQLVAWILADSAMEEAKYEGIIADIRLGGFPVDVPTTKPVPMPEPEKKKKGKSE